MPELPEINPQRDVWGKTLEDWLEDQHNSDGSHKIAASDPHVAADDPHGDRADAAAQIASHGSSATAHPQLSVYSKALSPTPFSHFSNNLPNKIMRGVFCQDLAMASDGGIYISELSENRVFCWPGGWLYINSEGDTSVRGNWCDLTVYGAVAGSGD